MNEPAQASIESRLIMNKKWLMNRRSTEKWRTKFCRSQNWASKRGSDTSWLKQHLSQDYECDLKRSGSWKSGELSRAQNWASKRDSNTNWLKLEDKIEPSWKLNFKVELKSEDWLWMWFNNKWPMKLRSTKKWRTKLSFKAGLKYELAQSKLLLRLWMWRWEVQEVLEEVYQRPKAGGKLLLNFC